MKKTLSQTNKDLDLRRFGKDVYTKASSQGGGGSSDSSSGEITIDDVVKFLHDAYATEDWLPFSYETAAEIPSLDDAIQAGLQVDVYTICKTTTTEEYYQAMDMMNDKMVLLFTPTFSIWAIQGMKIG